MRSAPTPLQNFQTKNRDKVQRRSSELNCTDNPISFAAYPSASACSASICVALKIPSINMSAAQYRGSKGALSPWRGLGQRPNVLLPSIPQITGKREVHYTPPRNLLKPYSVVTVTPFSWKYLAAPAWKGAVIPEVAFSMDSSAPLPFSAAMAAVFSKIALVSS